MKAPRLTRVLPEAGCAAAAAVALCLSSAPADAQFRGCALDDSRCIEIQIDCRLNDAPVDSCLLSIVAELQAQQGISPTTAVGTTLGLTYFELAQIADDDDEEALYLTRAREAYLDVIASDEAAADAYLGLAVLDWDSIDARIDWMRRHVAMNASNFSIRSFIDSLSELRTLDAYSEAVDTARAAYDRAEPGNEKWQFAILTYGAYQSANWRDPGTFDPRTIDKFVSQVREDSNLEAHTSALAEPARNPTAMRDALETTCGLMQMFGEELCMRGIETTVQAAIRYPDTPNARILADAAAIGAMAVPRGRVDNWNSRRDSLTAWLDQLVSSQLDSLVVLDAVASIVHDMNRRFEVRLEIVSRNPNSGRARFDLAQQYFNRKEWDLALPHLELARELLPPDDEFQNLVLEYLHEAEYEIRARN